jgi:hypothetical protein
MTDMKGDKHINSGKPWTAEDIAILVSGLHHGDSVAEIAAFLKRDGDEVDAKADFLGM